MLHLDECMSWIFASTDIPISFVVVESRLVKTKDIAILEKQEYKESPEGAK